jgi:hypothetical protein
MRCNVAVASMHCTLSSGPSDSPRLLSASRVAKSVAVTDVSVLAYRVAESHRLRPMRAALAFVD